MKRLYKLRDYSTFFQWGIFYFMVVGLVSIYLGQDFSWDLRNYHFYNPYMLLTGRINYDILPAQIQTFFNPLMDIPFFIAIYYLKVPPVICGFFWGGLHGLNLWLVHLIVYFSLHKISSIKRHLLGFLAALTGLGGAAYFSEIGTTLGDSTSSLFVLSSLLIFVHNLSLFPQLTLRAIILGGLILGLGTGLKFTTAIYGITLIIAINFINKNLKEKLYNTIIFITAMASGFLITAGYWMFLMWYNFRNPFFPFFNSFFKSLYMITDVDFKDTRFLPKDIWQKLFYPFYFTRKQALVSELEFRDFRLAIAYVLVTIFFLFLVIKFIQRIKVTPQIPDNSITNLSIISLIITFYITAYLIWLNQFSIYRYVVVLELLTPVLTILIIGFICQNTKVLIFLSTILFTVMVVNVIPLDWGRVKWTSSYLDINPKSLVQYENSVVILSESIDSSAYLVPYFPTSTKFVRINSNTGVEKGTLMQKKAEEIIKKTDEGQLYALDISPDKLIIDEAKTQKEYQLLVKDKNCHKFSVYSAKYSICPVQKAS